MSKVYGTCCNTRASIGKVIGFALTGAGAARSKALIAHLTRCVKMRGGELPREMCQALIPDRYSFMVDGDRLARERYEMKRITVDSDIRNGSNWNKTQNLIYLETADE